MKKKPSRKYSRQASSRSGERVRRISSPIRSNKFRIEGLKVTLKITRLGEMKGTSCALVASVIAASTVAFSSSSSIGDRDVVTFTPCSNQGKSWEQEISRSSASSPAEKGITNNLGRKASREKEKFAPRFDGLRFIETLVTAHR